MNGLSQAMQDAAGELQRISEINRGARRQRAAAVALVLRSLECSLYGCESGGFVARRARQEVEALPAGAERALLLRLLLLEGSPAAPGTAALIADLLVDYAYELEVTRRLPEAEAVINLALVFAPHSAAVALHAGRIARKQARHDRALELYRRARELDRASGAIGRLASIGEAVVSPDPFPRLAAVLRESIRARDFDAAAVALEERARLRRAAGDRAGAARDLSIAAVRYVDPVDRARVAHQLADLFASVGDRLAVREALLLALAVGDASQRDHAQARLHAISRDLGDQLGTRRWRSFQRPALVSLSPTPRTPSTRSVASRLARWRMQLESAVAAPA
ncbi:MAG TPA: hypothetical protein VF167_09180 [Longimicrobiaceae bacterium]